MHQAITVANYFLTLPDAESGELISNLKLQKLCYYAQGFSLAVLGRRLFDEDLVAWQHGPVVVSVYNRYKEYGAGAIPAPLDFSISVFAAEELELLNEVWSVYGQFSAWRLRDMTHDELPWKTTPKSEVISDQKLLDYFKTQVS